MLLNAYLNKTLDEQSLENFHRHMQHIENFTDSFLYTDNLYTETEIKHYDTYNRNDDIVRPSKMVNYL